MHALPPVLRAGDPLVFGAPSAASCLTESDRNLLTGLLEGDPRRLRSTAVPRYEKGAGFSCEHIRYPDGRVEIRACVIGVERRHEGVRPFCVTEFSAAHSPGIAYELISDNEVGEVPDLIEILFCNDRAC